jgi:serpin B
MFSRPESLLGNSRRARPSYRGRKGSLLHTRRLHLEPLENRFLLVVGVAPGVESLPAVVTPLGYDAAQIAVSTTNSALPGQASVATQQVASEAAVGNAMNAFASDLYALLQKNAGGGNLAFSPFSISTALAMTLAGARGATASQMADVLHFALDPNTMHSDFGTLLADLNSAGQASGYDLSVADALWGQAGYAFKDQFLNLVQANYGGGLNSVDFQHAAESARQTINDWVANETNQKIQNLIPEGGVTDLTRLVLTNAVYFKGQWAKPFDAQATYDAQFTLASGERVLTPTMHKQSSYRYMESDGFQVLELPYAGDRLSMVLMLPTQGDGAAGTDASAIPANLNQWLSGLTSQTVQVSLPKFQTTTKFSLADSLKALGMTDAFSSGSADLTGIADVEGEKLYISDVIHKAFIDVNETGTEAAAATAVIVAVGCACPGYEPPPVQFNADHPFQFLIRDNVSGSILFMGQVTNPAPDGTPVLPPDIVTTQEPIASKLVVTTTNDVVDPNDGVTSLREAIAYANTHPGDDTITFAPTFAADRVHQSMSLIAGELKLTDTTGTTTIVGPGEYLLTIGANRVSRVFHIANGVTADISGLAIAGGFSSDGGGIYNAGTLRVTDCCIGSNTAYHEGGGIWNSGSLTVTNTDLSWNRTVFIGGNKYGRPHDLYGWTHGSEGGAIENRGTLEVNGSTFFRNCSDEGGIIANHGTFALNDVTFSENFSEAADSDITDYTKWPQVDPVVASVVVTTTSDVVDPNDGLTSLREAIAYANAHPGNDTIAFAVDLPGDFITLTAGELEITDVTGTTTIIGFGKTYLTIRADFASRVFRIANGATADISALTITEGFSSDGGGIYNAGTLTVTDCSISSNAAYHEGGAIWNSGSLTVTDTDLSWNVTASIDGDRSWCPHGLDGRTNGSEGGAIENYGTLAVNRSLFYGNWSDEGGALANHGTFALSAVTFSENHSAMGDPEIADHNSLSDPVVQDFKRVDNLDDTLAQFVAVNEYVNSLRLDTDQPNLSPVVGNTMDTDILGSGHTEVAVTVANGTATLVAATTKAAAATSNDDAATVEAGGPEAKLAAFERVYASVGTDSFWNPLAVTL